ncbi:hypothetical protein GW17_00021391 [Ensete ventricosum]|nr:hypothetical protein GW17_00021391 [Ensete ventricosum]RZR94487.1 hypothetical protein BHM03_00023181 [Ensete ventricosum]
MGIKLILVLGLQALFFNSCKNLVVEGLVVKDSQQMHVVFRRCTDVKASKLTISAPESSPNTDGIHVTGSKSILIKDCIIETGREHLQTHTNPQRQVKRSPSVIYRNIKGTSASEMAMEFDCSRSHPCGHIVLQEIELVGEGGAPATSFCRFFQWVEIGKIIPAPCA